MQFVFLFINKLLTFLFCPITSASPVISINQSYLGTNLSCYNLGTGLGVFICQNDMQKNNA